MRRFYFRLALQLGYTVEELLDRCSSRELSEWMAYDSIEPFGQLRDDARIALLASTVVNMVSKKKVKVQDFMPFLKEDRTQTPEEMLAIMKGRC